MGTHSMCFCDDEIHLHVGNKQCGWVNVNVQCVLWKPAN